MPNPPLRVPWPNLLYAQPVGESEFGRPTGYVDPDAYRAKAASESLPSVNHEND